MKDKDIYFIQIPQMFGSLVKRFTTCMWARKNITTSNGSDSKSYCSIVSHFFPKILFREFILINIIHKIVTHRLQYTSN